MERPITTGLDGSPESRAAAEWAAREAALRRLPLHLVHAWAMEAPTARTAMEPEVRRHWALRILREAEADLSARHPDLSISAEQVHEPPVAALLERGERAEALVLGSRGHGAVTGFLLGSVGLRVLSRAACPVVLVRKESLREPDRAGDEVVVGVQATGEPAGALLDFAFTAAAARRLPLRAVRAWRLPPLFAHSPEALRQMDEDGGIEAHERRALAETLRPLREKFPDVPVVEHVELGSATEVLLTAATRARLLAVGRRTEHPALATRLGHVAYAVLHHAHCPIAVVPHD
ncbi:universal stress protein [Streptomyces pathocidini]|uniref:universal stress protein n=1 Tax=Streptomyces pathocidini TaxID=1650571 RepID=UPI0033FF91C4